MARPYKKWRRRINALLKNPDHPKKFVWMNEATGWCGCAVGERRKQLEKVTTFTEFGTPVDYTIFKLGINFISNFGTKKSIKVLDELDKICASKKLSH